MNTGAEAIETAIKLARKWAYVKKGVPHDKAIVYSAAGCFHGRTLASISLSSDEYCREGFGPFVPGLGPTVELPDGKSFEIRFNHAEDLERAFELHGENVAAFVVEPIQGEAGIIVPSENYLRQVQDHCRRHNVLFICDEIQAGLGRTGKLLAHHHWGVKPDIVTLAKALSGGTYPISAILSSSAIMVCFPKPTRYRRGPFTNNNVTGLHKTWPTWLHIRRQPSCLRHCLHLSRRAPRREPNHPLLPSRRAFPHSSKHIEVHQHGSFHLLAWSRHGCPWSGTHERH